MSVLHRSIPTAQGRQTQARDILDQLQAEQAARAFEKPPQPHPSSSPRSTPKKNSAPSRSGPWIDYDQANRELFDQFCRRDGEIYLEARLAVHEYGHSARAFDVAELIEPKAALWQRNRWGRVVITEKTTSKMLTSSASYWIDYFRRGGPPKAKAEHSKFDQKARTKGHQAQSDRSDQRAVQAQAFRLGGLTAAQIADALGVGVRRVRALYKRSVDPRALSEAIKRGVKSVRTLSVPAENFIKNLDPYRQKRRQPHTGQPKTHAVRPDSVPRIRCEAINAAQRLLDATRKRWIPRHRIGWSFGDAALDTG